MDYDDIRLICAPADDALTIIGSSFDRCCSVCQRRVMIAPSGQQILADHGDKVAIYCIPCHVKTKERDAIGTFSAKTQEQLLAELKDIVPNSWRWRN